MIFNKLSFINNEYVMISNHIVSIKPYFMAGYDTLLLKNNPYIPSILEKGFVSDTVVYTILDNEFVICNGHYMLNSLLKYVNNEYTVNKKYFSDLSIKQQELILNTDIKFNYISMGELGELQLSMYMKQENPNFYSEQEILNARSKGVWLKELMDSFANINSPYLKLINKYVYGNLERSHKLGKVLKWISRDHSVSQYMAKKYREPSAQDDIEEILRILYWIDSIFGDIIPDSIMIKKADIGLLYYKYHTYKYDKDIIRKRLLKALEKRNEPAFKITGAFEYALQKHDGKQVLFKRSFAASTIYSLYLKNPICTICGEPIKSLYDIEGDHIIPWIKGGLTEESNCQIVHKICNLKKGIKC